MQPNQTLARVLAGYRDGSLSLDQAVEEIEGFRIGKVGDLARLDLGRSVRCGMPEAVLAEGKTAAGLASIMLAHANAIGRSLATRVSPEQEAVVRAAVEGTGLTLTSRPEGGILILSDGREPVRTGGKVAIITAGTADIRVAEEARLIAEEMGCEVMTAYDVGAAGIHRLFPALQEVMGAHVFIVAAGREGTLPAVIAGLVDRPVIGVPVSTGYGYMGAGQAALGSMLQSCSVLSVVNIDAGFTAGAFAARIANLAVGEQEER
jgi:NCAIR mutase (PurE)-related protein